MTAYIVRRLVWLPILLLVISFITFVLGFYGPGNPVEILAGTKGNPVIIAEIEKAYGLDQPFHVQYFNYLKNVLQFDFGYSLVKYRDQKVSDLIAQRLPVTVQLNLVSIVWSVPLGLLFGIVAAIWRNSIMDTLVRLLVLGSISMHILLLLPLLTFIFSRQHDLRFFVFTISVGPFLPVGGWDGIFSTKIILPTAILGLGIMAGFMRQTRASMIEVMQQDYIRTARSKGLFERLVIVRHALRNGLLPLVTISGFLLADLFGGSILIERWYGIEGLGKLFFDSIFAREYYIILALTLLGAVAYVVANLIVDLAYAFVDPRIHYA